jgi:glucan phosphoethanolaminetransferase (alkaline phosphatase superfamily)
MLKLIQKQLDTKLVKTALIFAIVYFLLFNSAVLIYKFDYYKISFFSACIELFKDFIYIYISLFIIFFGLTIHRIFFIVGTIFLFISGSVASYYLYCFKITPTKEVIEAFFCTSINEAYELVSTKLIIWMVFSLFVALYTIKHFAVHNTKLFVTKLLSAVCILIMINNIILPQYKILNSYFPIQYLHNSYLYIFKGESKRTRIDLHKKFCFHDNSSEDIIGVLVIGESARFDHFGINGYERDTTPYLQNVENLFSFKAQSCSNVTHISVPCMISRHPTSNLAEMHSETSLLSIFTKLNFNTSWVATQSLLKYFKNLNQDTIYNDVNFSILPGGSTLLKMNDHDGVMIPYIENIIANNITKKQFLVIHTSGSHWNYMSRYPKNFHKFSPDCNHKGKVDFSKADPSSCSHEGLINVYDNSILYTDFFLHSVITLLKDKNAFLIYASDHGESLGENGRYGHGGTVVIEQTTIPFIVWFSDKFHLNNKQAKIAINSHINKEINHDYIFHSFLDCMGISSEVVDRNLSLCKLSNG